MKHGWERLGLVADVARLIEFQTAMDWDLARKLSGEARMDRVRRVGLTLARLLLEPPLPDEVEREISRDPQAVALAREATSAISLQGSELRDVQLAQFGSLRRRIEAQARAFYRHRRFPHTSGRSSLAPRQDLGVLARLLGAMGRFP
jgi:hypothetical protein